MPLVGVAFLPTLTNMMLAPDLLNLLCSLEYYLSTSHESLIKLAPTDWGPTLPPINHLEGRSVYAGVVTVVVRKLR